MRKILSGSIIYRLLTVIAAWIDSQWEKSAVIGWILRDKSSEEASKSSVFAKMWGKLHGLLCLIFKWLRLDRLLRDSVFSRTFFWCLLPAALAPLLPTMVLIAMTAMGFLSLAIRFGMERDRKLVYSPVNKFLFLFAFIYIVCTFTSVTFEGSIKGGLVTVIFILFAVVLQNAVKTRRELDILVAALVTVGAVVSAYGIYQFVFGADMAEAWVDSSMFSSVSVRVYSTLENPNVLAEYLLLITPISAACIFTGKTFNRRFLCALATGMMLLSMVLTFSRGGWLGLLAAAALFLLIVDRRFVVIGVVGLVALFFVLPDTIISRFTSIGDLSDGSTSYRLAIWMGTISMLKNYWFCGIGPGTDAFNKVYPAYSYNAATSQHAHNLYLQIMCDSGICGIIMFAIILFAFFRTLAVAMRKTTDKTLKLRMTALFAGIMGFAVQGMTDFSFYNYRVMFTFWVFIALGMIMARQSMEESE